MNGMQDWNDNPVLISVDSLENPLKDIEFPAITICPDFEPDHTALKELVFNLFEYNCDFMLFLRKYRPIFNLFFSTINDDRYIWYERYLC